MGPWQKICPLYTHYLSDGFIIDSNFMTTEKKLPATHRNSSVWNSSGYKGII